jgi:citrate synthase
MTAAKVIQMSTQAAKLTVGDQNIELPTIVGSEGERAVDINQLRAKTGFVTVDNGFMNTASCTSAITFLDGEQGILRYRGYPIEQLAESSNFIEVAYLLLHGQLPSKNEYEQFDRSIRQKTSIPPHAANLITQFPKNAHPMAVLGSVTMALSSFYGHLPEQNFTKEQMNELFAVMMGNFKQIAAMIYRSQNGKNFVQPNRDLDYCSDFMNMMFSNGASYKVDKDVARALDVLLILHADHEQNCSTSTVRMVGSSQASPFASIAAGVAALWGPLHGGANQAVLEMLEEIKNAGGDYKKFIGFAKDKNSTFKLMGFGHRVYKNFDPRAKIIKSSCDAVLAKLGVKDPLLEIAKGLEEEALRDSYFVERKLYPNVDFYSGIIYRALGIPTNMFTVMFALGRLPGWLAQWKEMTETTSTKIGRPRQIYTGETERNYKKPV